MTSYVKSTAERGPGPITSLRQFNHTHEERTQIGGTVHGSRAFGKYGSVHAHA